MAEVKRKRSCIACRTQDDKVNLHRVVRGADGRVSFDATGRAPGRGAYVCSMQCFEKVRKSRRLDAALKVSVSKEDYESIAASLACAIGSEEEEN